MYFTVSYRHTLDRLLVRLNSKIVLLIEYAFHVSQFLETFVLMAILLLFIMIDRGWLFICQVSCY